MLPAVTVTDNVGVHLFTTNVVNGSEVTWGEYNITYTAKDKAGNAAYCRFLITVAGMYVLYAYLENKKPVIAQEVRVQARSRLSKHTAYYDNLSVENLVSREWL